jgi:hypothetical protein
LREEFELELLDEFELELLEEFDDEFELELLEEFDDEFELELLDEFDDEFELELLDEFELELLEELDELFPATMYVPSALLVTFLSCCGTLVWSMARRASATVTVKAAVPATRAVVSFSLFIWNAPLWLDQLVRDDERTISPPIPCHRQVF